MADRPFATMGLSQTWFAREEDPLAPPEADDLESGPYVEVFSMIKDKAVPPTMKETKPKQKQKQKPFVKDRKRRMVLSTIQEKKERKEMPHNNPNKHVKRKRKTLTKRNPHEAQLHRAL